MTIRHYGIILRTLGKRNDLKVPLYCVLLLSAPQVSCACYRVWTKVMRNGIDAYMYMYIVEPRK